MVAHLSFPSGDTFLIAVVCDGMGGMAQGAEAAGCAASEFVAYFAAGHKKPLIQLLKDAVSRANQEVYQRFEGSGGTTLSAVVVMDTGEAAVGHVGDSRLYEGSPNQQLNLLTRDDTIGGQIRSSVDEDLLDNRLLQFVGVGGQIEPHIFRVPIGLGSTFLLTTDGAHSIGKKALEGISKNSSSTVELVRKIIFVAEAIGVEDNSSAVAISVSQISPLPNFSSGAELTIWSPSDKLEMWLGRQSPSGLNPPKVAQRASENRAAELNPAKSKRAAKSRTKSAGRAKAKEKKPEEDDEHPLFNIEFGSREKDVK